MKRGPQDRESRVPAIAIWTVCGLLLGLAFGVVISNVALPVLSGAVVGFLYGLYTTRRKITPDDD